MKNQMFIRPFWSIFPSFYLIIYLVAWHDLELIGGVARCQEKKQGARNGTPRKRAHYKIKCELCLRICFRNEEAEVARPSLLAIRNSDFRHGRSDVI